MKVPGDVNRDGSINALDVVAEINAVLGVQPSSAADVNGDGAVNALNVGSSSIRCWGYDALALESRM